MDENGEVVAEMKEMTRIRIAEAVSAAFDQHAPTPRELADAARAAGDHEVAGLVESLDQPRYGRLNDLWPDLPDLPIDS